MRCTNHSYVFSFQAEICHHCNTYEGWTDLKGTNRQHSGPMSQN